MLKRIKLYINNIKIFIQDKKKERAYKKKRICNNCKQFEFITYETIYNTNKEKSAKYKKGNCKRNAPFINGEWPKVLENDWCGKFEK